MYIIITVSLVLAGEVPPVYMAIQVRTFLDDREILSKVKVEWT
jgi:hypothetical protein